MATWSDPRRPPISRGLQIRKQKMLCLFFCKRQWFYSSSSQPPGLLPFSSSLFLLSATLQRASLIYSAQRPGDEKADRCLVTSRPAWGHCKEGADPFFSGSADKGARGRQRVARRHAVTLGVGSLNVGHTSQQRGCLLCCVTWGSHTTSRASGVKCHQSRPSSLHPRVDMKARCDGL